MTTGDLPEITRTFDLYGACSPARKHHVITLYYQSGMIHMLAEDASMRKDNRL